MGKIYIIDVTNRDGVQTAKLGLSKLEKTLINVYLNEMGIFQSEFGFPTTHHESHYLQANLELARVGRGVIASWHLEISPSRRQFSIANGKKVCQVGKLRGEAELATGPSGVKQAEVSDTQR